MRELSSQIEFDATPDEVWEVLQDLARHAEWNPFITKIDGELHPGAKLDVRLEPEGERGITMHPTVLAVEPGRELRWLGHLLVPGVFDGEHRFLIEESGPGRVRSPRASASGDLAAAVLEEARDGGTAKGFRAMNEALARASASSTRGRSE